MTDPNSLLGRPVDRVDGPIKAAGAARYAIDVSLPNMVHGVIVQSTIAAGRIRRFDASNALSSPGVLAVISHENAPRLGTGPMSVLGPPPPPPFQHDRVLHHGQHVACVVAETHAQAVAAARRIEIDYETSDALVNLDDPRVTIQPNPFVPDEKRGDVAQALRSAEVQLDVTYRTPPETHNPIGLFATVATWEGDALTVYDTTQFPTNIQAVLAASFGIPSEGVRVIAQYIGGAFGAGLRFWPHVTLAALGARTVGRPVKVVLNRGQMFTSIGYRPPTVQRVKVGATRDGSLVAIDHESIEPLAMEDFFAEPVTPTTAKLYACPHVSTRDRQVRLHVGVPSWMRAPGEAQGAVGLECALDELAYALHIDPLELRLRNFAETHPGNGLPWSTNALRACYEEGARRFEWSRRTFEPRSMRKGSQLVGLGMATGSLPYYQMPCEVRASIDSAGRVYVGSAGTDIGPGTYTIMTQVAADVLGLPMDAIRVDLGDTRTPPAPQQGGSGLAAALSSATFLACRELLKAFLDVAQADPRSPLHEAAVGNGNRRRDGCLDDVRASNGRIALAHDLSRADSYTEILRRSNRAELAALGKSAPRQDPDKANGVFSVKFAEVHIDRDLGRIRVTRLLAVIDAGRVLNPKTAASQIVGAAVGGIGMALLEETLSDPGTGRIANGTFGDYLVAVNADVPDVDVLFVGQPDPANPLGVKGVGEIGLVGIAPAIANAVFHATGRRIRSLPITLDQLL
ncbi:MAG TPA: xanthine dehydrogenase family protein molybdopterin-binding subunit [Vicinamibacterales bacterium]|jgi:xanthine dehydrogenase YagR molybdenum-binding subunit|nr:xanthine dehydrogenase family protein molybdopterin-binding subunit [Vicinamibacterales bacterium]